MHISFGLGNDFKRPGFRIAVQAVPVYSAEAKGTIKDFMKAIHQKRMPRLYVEGDLNLEQHVVLTAEQGHYLMTVLRKKEGDHIVLFNGRQGEWVSILQKPSKKEWQAVCMELVRPQGETPTVWLGFSPLKKHRQDFLVEKASELGVTHLVPLEMRYTNLLSFNREKVLKQVIEASEQCERLSVPEILPLRKLATFLEEWPKERILYVALERKTEGNLKAVLEKDKEAGFLVGPEGGFSPEEVELLSRYPFVRFFSLGSLILRAETAAILCVGLYGQLRAE